MASLRRAMLLGQSVSLLLTCLTAGNSEVPRSYVTHPGSCGRGVAWAHTSDGGAARCLPLAQAELATDIQQLTLQKGSRSQQRLPPFSPSSVSKHQ